MCRTSELAPVAGGTWRGDSAVVRACTFLPDDLNSIPSTRQGAEPPVPIAPGYPTLLDSMGAHKPSTYYRDMHSHY